jgi:hypothetical protein
LRPDEADAPLQPFDDDQHEEKLAGNWPVKKEIENAPDVARFGFISGPSISSSFLGGSSVKKAYRRV